MHKRWISLFFTGLFLLAYVHPSDARLIEAKTNLSRVINHGGNPTIAYRVQAGDNPWSIARSNGINLTELLLLNNWGENSVLKIGEVIKLPLANSESHVVCAGETMWSIAAKYGLNIGIIENANRDKNPNSLKIGDRLIIPRRNSAHLLQAAEPSRGSSFSGSFSWPLTGVITSNFGWRQSGYHHGIDIAGELGTPIKAAADGVVTFVGWKSVYGNTVIIQHSDGKSTLYAHAQKILVQEKQSVKRGQQIARVGISGRTTGPHLHFEIRIADKCYDPLNYLNH